MPPKGYQSLGEVLITVATRMPASMVEAVDAHIPRLHAQAPWARVNRADALRDLVSRALQQVQQEDAMRPGDVPPSTGPALLGLEQATPAPTLPPVTDPENAAPVDHAMTPLQQVVLTVPAPQAVEAAATVPVPELENSIDLGGAGFDPAKHRLGKLCPRGHDWQGTGQSLRKRSPGGGCLECDAERARERRQAKQPSTGTRKR